MLQGVLPHDLFQRERVSSRLFEFRLLLDLDPVFKYIVHTAARPALVVRGQRKVITFTPDSCIARFLYSAPDPYIVIVIGIRMPQYQVNIIAVSGVLILDGKTDGWPETAVPLLTGKSNILFKNVRRQGTAHPLKAAE